MRLQVRTAEVNLKLRAAAARSDHQACRNDTGMDCCPGQSGHVASPHLLISQGKQEATACTDYPGASAKEPTLKFDVHLSAANQMHCSADMSPSPEGDLAYSDGLSDSESQTRSGQCRPLTSDTPEGQIPEQDLGHAGHVLPKAGNTPSSAAVLGTVDIDGKSAGQTLPGAAPNTGSITDFDAEDFAGKHESQRSSRVSRSEGDATVCATMDTNVQDLGMTFMEAAVQVGGDQDADCADCGNVVDRTVHLHAGFACPEGQAHAEKNSTLSLARTQEGEISVPAAEAQPDCKPLQKIQQCISSEDHQILEGHHSEAGSTDGGEQTNNGPEDKSAQMPDNEYQHMSTSARGVHESMATKSLCIAEWEAVMNGQDNEPGECLARIGGACLVGNDLFLLP
eukprot:evm.model.scf_162EXC.6 EVM.evm.TU.scf_162EXC.6   scf_162EXC:41336-42523(+)